MLIFGGCLISELYGNYKLNRITIRIINLPNTATEVLIKILLKDCENIDHESFPNTLYKAKKSLGLVDQFTSFAACQKCHKLYNKDDVTNIQRQTVMKCSHIEFPNLPTNL